MRVAVVVTECLRYRHTDFERLRSALAGRVLIDGRNLYDPARVRAFGFQYSSIGRP